MHQIINLTITEFYHIRLHTIIHICLQFCVVIEVLSCEPGLHVLKQVIVTRRKTVRQMIKDLTFENIHKLSSVIGYVRVGVVMKKKKPCNLTFTDICFESLFITLKMFLSVYCRITSEEIHQ